MTPAGTSNELDVQNEWEENTHTHTHTERAFKEKAAMVQKIILYSEKATSQNKQEGGGEHVWLSRRLHIEGRLKTTGPVVADSLGSERHRYAIA